MQFKTYVQKNKPVYMYIHGECLSAFSFQEEIRELKKDYTLIVPVLDGHGSEAQKPFISIQQCAEELLTYLQEYYNGHIQVLSGFSLGAQIAVSMLSMKPDLCEYAMIESAMMQPIKLQMCIRDRNNSDSFFLCTFHRDVFHTAPCRNNIPVSYTHLDVYKRQLSQR